jgi:CelD/BcsL family acetyltransferase involved in cellulose biosynthesis
MMAATDVEISVVAHLDGFDALADEWDPLVRAMPRPSPFFLHGWLATWWRHFGGNHSELAVITARRDATLVGALPLMIRRGAGRLRICEFIGSTDAKLGDVLVAADEDDSVAGRLAEAAAAHPHDLADLAGLPARSRLGSLLGPRRLRVIEDTPAPVLDISPGWETVYREKTSRKTRYNHGRQLRLLSELGAVSFSTARTAAELREALESAFRLHDLRWRGRSDASYFGFEAGRQFHRDVVGELANCDAARILTLRLDGRPVAFTYYFILERRLYLHRIAFDPGFGRFSPGLSTTIQMLQTAADEGVAYVEFMAGSAEYKLLFADRSDPICRAVGLPGSARGRIALSLIGSRARLRATARRSGLVRSTYSLLRRKS